MIDTVVLNLNREKVFFNQNEKWDLISKKSNFSKFIKNPSKNNLESGNYYPRLTGIVRGAKEKVVKIEFSIPKLLFNNNLDEVKDSEFELVLTTLQKRLKEMCVEISLVNLSEASVSVVHFSKNIILNSGYSSSYVISELQKINLNKSKDLTKTKFLNNGESLQCFSISNSFVFYDKIADLKKDEKRAIDKDQTIIQTMLFEEMKEKEILRYEVRLSQKRKLNSMLKDFGFNTNPTFKDVYSENVALKFLNYYWIEKVDKNKYILYNYIENTESLLKKISILRPKLKPYQKLTLLGLVSFAKDNKGGLRELRNILYKNKSDRSWYSLEKNFKILSNDINNLCDSSWFQDISKQIYFYNAYRK